MTPTFDVLLKKLIAHEHPEYTGGGSGGSTEWTNRQEIGTLLKTGYNNYWVTNTFDDGVITKTEIFGDESKTGKIFTLDYVYTDGYITTATITDNGTGNSLLETYTYNEDKQITESSVVYTEV